VVPRSSGLGSGLSARIEATACYRLAASCMASYALTSATTAGAAGLQVASRHPAQWEREWEHGPLRPARSCFVPLMRAQYDLHIQGSVQVMNSEMHSWRSRGRRFKSGRPDW
jgi:hypothetical protein